MYKDIKNLLKVYMVMYHRDYYFLILNILEFCKILNDSRVYYYTNKINNCDQRIFNIKHSSGFNCWRKI